MNEMALADEMERCVFPNADFHHAEHVRLAWHYVRVYGERGGTTRMRETILRYATSLGHAEKYHETATVAWMRLVAAAVRLTPRHEGFAEFAAAHPWLLNRDALAAFYSAGAMASAEARAGWVEADLGPLPVFTSLPA